MSPDVSGHYDAIAPGYDAQIDTVYNQAVRECFWRCADSVLKASSRILDFGAGTGLDAERFASLGHSVTAYDISSGMLDVLRQRCAAQIAEGSVATIGGPLEEASAVLFDLGPFDAVISNFAVFSTIADLGPVFELLASALKKGGLLLILIQNPWDSAHLTTLAFWKSLLTSGFSDTLQYESAELGTIYHRTASKIVRLASRDFAVSNFTVEARDRSCLGRLSHFNLVELSRR